MPWSDFHFAVFLSSCLEDCTQHAEREREREMCLGCWEGK